MNQSLIKLIEQIGFWGLLLLAIFTAVWWFFADVVKNDPTRKRVIGWLLQDTAAKRYRRLLARVLDGIDVRLSSDRGTLPATSARVAWSRDLLGFCLVLALGYPLLSLLLNWASANTGAIGGIVVLPPSPWPARLALVAALCGLVLAILWSETRLQGRRQLVFQLVAYGFAFAVAGTFAVAVAVAGAFAFAGTFAGAVALAGAFAVDYLGKRVARGGLLLLGWALVGLGVSFLAVTNTPGFSVRADGTSAVGVILFISLLPLLNALADFASCGLTRYWLRRGIAGNLLLAGLRDAAAGAVIFLLLGFSIIATIHWVRPQDGVPLTDLEAIFSGLSNPDTRGHYWWLGAMLASTLLPTLAHLILAMLAFFTLAPDHWRHRIAALLDTGAKGDDLAGRAGRVMLCLGVTAAVFVPVFLLWQAYTMRHGVLDGLIALFRAFAAAIGAIPA